MASGYSRSMTTNAPPAGTAGVSARMPATRTWIGPIADSVLSWAVPRSMTAAAAGEASTGTVVPKATTPPGGAEGLEGVDGPAPILAAGKAENGVAATTAA